VGKPLLAGVPNWLIDHWLAALKDGRMDSYNQRELHKVLLHKWSGKPGVPDLTCIRSARELSAANVEWHVRQEIHRMKAAEVKTSIGGGGYRAEALDAVAEHSNGRWKSGETLGRWLTRNRGPKANRRVRKP
jgi:hypothetical protein